MAPAHFIPALLWRRCRPSHVPIRHPIATCGGACRAQPQRETMLFQGRDQAQDRRHSRIPNWRATKASTVRWTSRVYRSGAPRSTKMGTIRSPSHYDAGACCAFQSADLRRPTLLHYAAWRPSSRFRGGGPVILR